MSFNISKLKLVKALKCPFAEYSYEFMAFLLALIGDVSETQRRMAYFLRTYGNEAVAHFAVAVPAYAQIHLSAG